MATPRVFAAGLGELEGIIRRSEQAEQEASTLGGLSRRIKQFGDIRKEGRRVKKEEKKEAQVSRKEFLNTYFQLREKGVGDADALEEAKRVSGSDAKEFNTEGFEVAAKKKLGIAEEKSKLGLRKTRAEIAKLEKEAGSFKLGKKESSLMEELSGLERGEAQEKFNKVRSKRRAEGFDIDSIDKAISTLPTKATEALVRDISGKGIFNTQEDIRAGGIKNIFKNLLNRPEDLSEQINSFEDMQKFVSENQGADLSDQRFTEIIKEQDVTFNAPNGMTVRLIRFDENNKPIFERV